MKNILIINTSSNDCLQLSQIFKKMKEDGFGLSYWTKASTVFDELCQRSSCMCKNKKIGPLLENGDGKRYSRIKSMKFTLTLPWLYLRFFCLLSFYKLVRKTEVLLMWGWNEKIVLTPIASLLKIRTVWLHCPNQDMYSKPGLIARHVKKLSKKVPTICFLNKTKQILTENGFPPKNVHVVTPGIKLLSHERQSNIFDSIAKVDHEKSGKKFFSIGTVLDLDKEQKLEYLFQAVKDSRRVIPNIQLIVVGEGTERKNLIWLIKKMEIENIVWFIGKQKHIRKWLSGFDAYINIKTKQSLGDLNNLIKAMSLGLPIIGPRDAGLEDFITDNTDCLLFSLNDVEELTSHIINLKQNINLRKSLGRRAEEKHQRFEFNDMYNEFINHFE